MIANLMALSVRARWMIIVLVLLVSTYGAWQLTRLPIDAVPDITNNQVQINIEYPSLSPVEVEKQITFPIETALAGIPGLESTRSLSRNGFAQVTAVFKDEVDIYFARQQVGERLSEARESLPAGAEPRMGAISTGLGEVYMWTVEYEHPAGEGAEFKPGQPGWQSQGVYRTPEGRNLTGNLELASYLREVQDWIIRPQLKGVPNVAGIDAIGGFVKEYHVQPNPMKLVSYGLTFQNLLEALERNNASTGAGYIEHKGEAYLVRATGRITDEAQIADIVIGSHNGTPIRVSDVAVVGIGPEMRTGSASENGEEVVVGTALMLLGANSRTVAADVDAKMQIVNRSLPPGIRAKTVMDRTALVDATIKTVSKNLAEGAIFVVVVLFLMLGNVRAAIICALAIPLSMLITATGMVQGKISGNLMSLGAIDFGLVVDGAVIIVENCMRRLAHRQHLQTQPLKPSERIEEILTAAREMIRPSVFGQAIIITVYLPILFLVGIEGKMFRPMAWTVIFALVAAFILSVTLVPALVAIMFNKPISEKDVFLVRWAKRAYEPVLRFSLRFRVLVVALAVAFFAASLWWGSHLGQEFVPTLDEKNIAMHAMRIPSTGITQSTQMQLDLEKEMSKIPEIAFIYSKTGTAEMASDPMPPSVSDTFVILKPDTQWRPMSELMARIAEIEPEVEKLSTGHDGHDDHGHDDHGHGASSGTPTTHKEALIRLIELSVRLVPGTNYEFTQPIQMRFNELISGVRSDVAVKVYGDEFEVMAPTASAVAAVLQSIAGAADVKIEQTDGLPVMNIDIDRAAIARHGLSIADVQDVISVAIGGREAGLVFQGDRRFSLVVRLPDDVRRNLDALAELPIPLPHAESENMKFAIASEGRRSLTATDSSRLAFIPLSAVAKIDIAEGLNQISRENGKRRIVIQANVRGRDIGSFVAEAQRRIAAEVKTPAGYWFEWGGQFENLVAARARLMIVVPLCFFMIFLLLFGSFGNVRQAFIVFTAVPLALTGGIIALMLRDMPFSITAAVGFIALSGVAVLNGLVMISFINQLRSEGQPMDQAIIQGSLTRLRPVLMTAMVASLGFVPMALATGTGAEVQRPLATVVIGGIISSTLLTLVVLPALYRLFGGGEKRATDPLSH